MSFDHLLVHAYDIQRRAIEVAVSEQIRRARNSGGNPLATVDESGIRSRAERLFADIPALFGSFVDTPSPDWFGPAVDDYDLALRRLFLGQDTGQVTATEAKAESGGPLTGTNLYKSRRGLRKLSASESYLENWSGKAALEFKKNFIDPFPAVVYNQFQMVAALRAALEAEREIWARTRRDIDQIAHDTLAALDRAGSDIFPCERNDWEMMFTVVGAVFTIPAAVATGGATVALAFAAGSATVAAVAASHDEPPTVRFSAGSAPAVIAEMRDAIGMLVRYVHQQETKIADGMLGLLRAVDGDRPSFVSKRPDLANATPQNVTGPLHMGYAH